LDTIAHGSNFGRGLNQFTRQNNLGVQQVAGDLYQNIGLKGKRLLAIESIVVTVFGEPEGAR